MKKKLLLAAATAAVLSSSISVCAAPQYMSDGAVFDPEWYLEQNPDVAGWALGTSADALYQHYTLHGAAEGRQPYNAAALDPAGILPYQGTDPAAAEQSAETTQPTASQEQKEDSETIIAVEGQTYSFPSIHSDRFNYENCTVNVTFSKGEISEYDDYFSDYLAAYTLPGYEWRKFDVSASSSAGSYYANIASTGDFLRVQAYKTDENVVTSDESVWDYIDENGWVLHAATFTVSQNGTEYPDCKLFETWNYSNAGEASFSWYALVPKGFNGGMYAGYRGRQLENGKTVVNESSPHILFGF